MGYKCIRLVKLCRRKHKIGVCYCNKEYIKANLCHSHFENTTKYTKVIQTLCYRCSQMLLFATHFITLPFHFLTFMQSNLFEIQDLVFALRAPKVSILERVRHSQLRIITIIIQSAYAAHFSMIVLTVFILARYSHLFRVRQLGQIHKYT